MIRRNEGTDWLLFSQVDHAHLAAEIAQVWGNSQVSPLPLPDQLVPAIRDHDDGWRDWERAPQLDPETGSPRDFTEMPMAVAAKIWGKSIYAAVRGIGSQSAALQLYQRHLADRNETLSGDRAATLDAVLQYRATFRRDEAARVAKRADVSGEAFGAAFDELIQAGIIGAGERDVVGEYDHLELPVLGSSPLGGLWVSRHFCYLAEKASESRRDDSDELMAIDKFLEEQASLQKEWTGDSVRNFAGDDLRQLIETGYRYVQFFDRISLWLCCAERTETVEMKLPGGNTFQLIPETANRIRIEPFPLNVASLKLTVNARRIPARSYTDDACLQKAITTGGIDPLEWTICG